MPIRPRGIRAATGQTCTQLPQKTHVELAIAQSNGVATWLTNPRPETSIAFAPTISSHTRVQRPHRMQYWWSRTNIGLSSWIRLRDSSKSKLVSEMP